MNLFDANENNHMSSESLFNQIFLSKDEKELTNIFKKYPQIFNDDNWKPLGANKSNYWVMKNRQSNPIAALIEKVTYSIDALLTKKCFEQGTKPDSKIENNYIYLLM